MHEASLLEMKGRSHLRISGSAFSEVKVKADILVSIWLIFHAKASCCYRTNSKRKRRRFILDLVCVDDVSQNFRPPALSTHNKVHWQILGDRRLQ